MYKRFEMKYELLVTYDSGRELVFNSFNMTDAESKANLWIQREGVRRVDVYRTEKFFARKFFPKERNT